jgi:hypothetical protein
MDTPPRRRRRAALGGALLAAALVAAGCSSSGDAAAGATTTTAAETAEFTGAEPEEIAPPPAEGNGINLPQPAAALPEGYVQEEYLVGGTATSFEGLDTPADGSWVATPAEEAEYRTRVIVRRPASPEAFSGTVLLEWFNVSAIEASPDWAYLSGEIGREGHAYIGVSAQRQGVEGGDTLLDVEVDSEAVPDAGAGVSTDTSGLKNVDPARYGTLSHPGDAYAFDIFSQVGRAAEGSPVLLGGLEPTQVLAVGESQSAFFLTTLVNAVHPLDPVFDGFLIHSRGGNAAPLDGDIAAQRESGDAAEVMRRGVLVRTDLDVPVMIFQTETDLTLLGFASARQPDTDGIRTWEVAGTSHADAQFIRAILGGPRDPGLGSLLGCTEPINTGPHKETVQAALHHFTKWAAGGPPPPAGEALELDAVDDPDGDEASDDASRGSTEAANADGTGGTDGEVTIRRDEQGNALGGVRNPMLDVPTATLSGDPPPGTSMEDLAGGEGGVCILFGTTVPFDQATLVELYGTPEAYRAAFRASADEAVEAGHLLRPDADALVAETETVTF